MGLAHSLESTQPVTFPLPLSGAGLARVRQAGALLPPVARAYVMPGPSLPVRPHSWAPSAWRAQSMGPQSVGYRRDPPRPIEGSYRGASHGPGPTGPPLRQREAGLF